MGEQQYLNLIKDILDNGEWKDAARPGMPRTKEVFFRTMTFDLSEGYPLFTIKQMAWKTCLTELTWFLKGDTNIRYLVDNGCKIWNDDAYKYYKRNGGTFSFESWMAGVKRGEPWTYTKDDGYTMYRRLGDLGRVYGGQWRKNGWNGFDQVQYVIDNLKNNPSSRYNIICAWSPDEYLGRFADVALPACHVYYQFCASNSFQSLVSALRYAPDRPCNPPPPTPSKAGVFASAPARATAGVFQNTHTCTLPPKYPQCVPRCICGHTENKRGQF